MVDKFWSSEETVVPTPEVGILAGDEVVGTEEFVSTTGELVDRGAVLLVSGVVFVSASVEVSGVVTGELLLSCLEDSSVLIGELLVSCLVVSRDVTGELLAVELNILPGLVAI